MLSLLTNNRLLLDEIDQDIQYKENKDTQKNPAIYIGFQFNNPKKRQILIRPFHRAYAFFTKECSGSPMNSIK